MRVSPLSLPVLAVSLVLVACSSSDEQAEDRDGGHRGGDGGYGRGGERHGRQRGDGHRHGRGRDGG